MNLEIPAFLDRRTKAQAFAAPIAEPVATEPAKPEPAPRVTCLPGSIYRKGKGYRARVAFMARGKLIGQKTGARFWATPELAECQARIAALSVARDYSAIALEVR